MTVPPDTATPVSPRALSLMLAGCGMAGALLAWRGIAALMPEEPAASSMAVRLGEAAAALLPGSFVLAAMIVAQALGRFLASAFDPLAGADSRFLRTNQRVITNTVEQFAVFTPALLALAAGAGSAHMPAIEAVGITFALARLVFWGGYLLAPMARAPGMAATLAVTAATWLAAARAWVG